MKTILITGASRGIGRAIAEKFALGNKIIITGRDLSKLNETAELVNKNGGEAVIVETDLSDPQNVVTLIENLDISQLDILINNAGIAIVVPFEELTLENWQRTFDVNVTAPFLLIQKLHKIMPKGSSIINIASVASKEGFPNWSSYCMSKFALDGFTKSVREELRGKDIRVINIYPGAVATDIWKTVSGEQNLEAMMKPASVADLVFTAVAQPSGTVVEDITMRNLHDF